MLNYNEEFLIVLVSDKQESSIIYDAFIILRSTIKHNRISINYNDMDDIAAMMPAIVIFDDIPQEKIPADLIERIKDVSPYTHFIYFSNTFSEDLFLKVIEKKIDYCICYEQFSPSLLSVTVINILSKVLYIKKISKIIINGNDVSMNLIDRKVWKLGKPLYLTNFEYDILRLLLENKGKFFKREEIFQKVWGYDKDNTGLVTQYIFKLKQKIGPSNILNSPQKGYCFRIKG